MLLAVKSARRSDMSQRSSKYGKLVRDGIPAIIRKNGEEPITTVLSSRELKWALFEKLIEEAVEVRKATSHKKLVEELADVEEVLSEICKFHRISTKEVFTAQVKARKERGGFKGAIFLEGVRKK